MNFSQGDSNGDAKMKRIAKAVGETAGLLRGPQRVFPLLRLLAVDRLRLTFGQHHLYSYTATKRQTSETLQSVLQWILDAQRPDGGIAAYFSLLSGYSESYPEVTGYTIPTLYDCSRLLGRQDAAAAAERATRWLLPLQMPSGAFPAGLHGAGSEGSVFNTGQILQGLVCAYRETNRPDLRSAAIAAANWLANVQQPDGSWSGPEAYQGVAHSYYSMVSWALAALSEAVDDDRYGLAAERNLDWVLHHFRPSGWIDGINLRGHPNYLHFIAYILQGVLECAVLRNRKDALRAVEKPSRLLLRKFEINKFLPGAYNPDFKSHDRYACLTGNAQMSAVWLRLFQQTDDLRYLNAALKMNEMLKQVLPLRGPKGIAGGVGGSFPLWGAYQPMRYISWGCKFLADALLLEQKLTQPLEACSCA